MNKKRSAMEAHFAEKKVLLGNPLRRGVSDKSDTLFWHGEVDFDIAGIT